MGFVEENDRAKECMVNRKPAESSLRLGGNRRSFPKVPRRTERVVFFKMNVWWPRKSGVQDSSAKSDQESP